MLEGLKFYMTKKEAKDGDIYALYDLAQCYHYGKGTAIDYKLAKRYYLEVIENLNEKDQKKNDLIPKSQLNLARVYMHDGTSDEKSISKMRDCFFRAYGHSYIREEFEKGCNDRKEFSDLKESEFRVLVKEYYEKNR